MLKNSIIRVDSETPEKTADMLKALGHPVRLKVIQHLLTQQCCCCGELCQCFDHSQSTISQHLGVLKDAGVLTAKKDGTRMLYSIDPVAFQYLDRIFSEFGAQAAELSKK